MTWPDKVMALTQCFFVFALVPSIRSGDKPAFATSALNVVLVIVIATCQATLGLWFATSTSVLVASGWAILGAQKLIGGGASQRAGSQVLGGLGSERS